MVHPAPPRSPHSLHTFDGAVFGRVCKGNACLFAGVRTLVQVDDDGAWMATCWDDENEEIVIKLEGTNRQAGEAMIRLLGAISAVALAPTQP